MDKPAEIAVGPLLYVDACSDDVWRIRLNVVFRCAWEGPLDCPLVVGCEDADVDGPHLLADLRSSARHAGSSDEGVDVLVWSWVFSAERSDDDRWIAYTVREAAGWNVNVAQLREDVGHDANPAPDVARFDHVCVPGRSRLPNFVFHSCSWFSAADKVEDVETTYASWDSMLSAQVDAHRLGDRGLHFAIGGGDQVYSDVLLEPPAGETKDTLLTEVWDHHKSNRDLPDDAERRLLDQFLELYAERWSQPQVARVLARIPGAFTWDDHEIMDGWGSYQPYFLHAPGPSLVYRVGRRAFELMQLGVVGTLRFPRFDRPPYAPPAPPRGLPEPTPRPSGSNRGPHFLQSLSFRSPDAELHVLVLDLRTNRTRNRVLGQEQWADLRGWLEGFTRAVTRPDRQARKRHLLVVSAIPLAFISTGGLAWVLEKVPAHLGPEDDLNDQWESPTHLAERLELLDALFTAAHEASCSVSILSGDVHVGARAEFTSTLPEHGGRESAPARLRQLTASGTVHPPPSWPILWFEARRLDVGDAHPVGDGLSWQAQTLFGEAVLGRNNHLIGRFDTHANLEATWVVQAEPDDRPAEPRTETHTVAPR